MKTIGEYQRLGSVDAIVMEVMRDAAADTNAAWTAKALAYDPALVDLRIERARLEGFEAGRKAATAQPRKRVVQREATSGRILGMVDVPITPDEVQHAKAGHTSVEVDEATGRMTSVVQA